MFALSINIIKNYAVVIAAYLLHLKLVKNNQILVFSA